VGIPRLHRFCGHKHASSPVYIRYILKVWREPNNDPLDSCTGFEWDAGNALKNWARHQVAQEEAEDLFFNDPLVVRSDVRHSKAEKRYYALGKTNTGRRLFVAFTIRNTLIRVISVRDMNRKERDTYAKREKETNT